MANGMFDLVDRAAAVEAIRRMNEDDLRFLNRMIVERLKLISQARSTTMLARFNLGDRVSFPANTGERKSGVIVRLNKKTASIATDDGQQWNVHPSFMMPIEPGAIDVRVEKIGGENVLRLKDE
jgi:hypothetical protein